MTAPRPTVFRSDSLWRRLWELDVNSLNNTTSSAYTLRCRYDADHKSVSVTLEQYGKKETFISSLTESV